MDNDPSLNVDVSSEPVSHYENLMTQSRKIEKSNSTFRNWSIDLGNSQNIKMVKAERPKNQFMALIKKSVALQAKQKGTNICQVLTPIICLLFVWLIKSIMSGQLTQKYSFQLPFPFMFNVPYNSVYGKGNELVKGMVSPITINECLQWYLYDFEGADDFTKNFVGNQYSGMLSHMFPPLTGSEYMYQCGIQGPMPYFEAPKNSTIDEDIYQNLRTINNLPLTNKKEISNLSLIPDGAVTFYEASEERLSVKLQINNLNYNKLHRANGVTRYKADIDEKSVSVTTVPEGQLILLDLITQSYSQTLFDDVYMISGVQPMPVTSSKDIFMSQIYNVIGATLYPIALSLLLPVFLYALVLEKEERLREIMKMSGLKISNYWTANYTWSLCMYTVAAFLFYLVGRFAVKLDFFMDTNPMILFVTFFGWGLSQVSLSIFFQNFIAKAKTAIIFGYLVALWTALIGSTLGFALYASPKQLPTAVLIYPPIAFTRIIYLLCFRCGSAECVSEFAELNAEMTDCLKVLYIGALFFFLLGLYLDEVLPKEYGVKKHPLFFIKNLFPRTPQGQRNSVARKVSDKQSNEDDREEEHDINEDEELREERKFVEKLQSPFTRFPLVIKHLRKVYKPVGGKPAKIAVEDFSLHIKRGETFGLLGPNGAGKTSLISMLTGLYPPESGNAWIGGYDILDEIDQVHTQIGVCPQFDLLWPDLTVEEHLYFYARIRGIPAAEEKAVVEKAIKEVYLSKFASFQTKRLSGGMKRRLSVAIALVGDPKVIYLDEPTTGLDPENRRQLWNILAEAKGDKAMILTTHSMEEADVLCTRIGIMTDGAIQCMGSNTRLKFKYGGGYHLFVNCHKNKRNQQQLDQSQEKCGEEDFKRVQQYIKNFLPQCEVKSDFNGNFVFLIPTKDLEVSKIFVHLESKKEELGISDWGISQSTLEDVFMEVV